MDLMMTAWENGLATMISRCICGKVYKNERGLEIHQAQMKCLAQEIAAQCTISMPGEMEEESGPEILHRTFQQQIKWPPEKDHK